MRTGYFYGLYFFFLSLVAGPLTVSAQEGFREKEMPAVSTTYAIQSATIIPSPGVTILNATVVFKNGVILAAGKNIAVPPEAMIIKGDSLFVYAGFIDGLSHAGVVKPKEESGRERPKDPGNPTPEAAGISPQNDVRNYLSPLDKSIEDIRVLGFTTAQVVPYGGMLPGQAAIIQLNGKTADNMVMVAGSSLFSQLTGAQRVYPGTVLGVMAKWRELYRQSVQSKNYAVIYAANRKGLARPASDRILEAFYPVIDRGMPVLFKADRLLDVSRVTTLQTDLGFLLTVADLKEGWDVIEKLRARNTKVFLSLDLPEDKSKNTAGKTPVDEKEKTDTTGFTGVEKRALEKRRNEFMALYVGQASAFQKAGVVFGFSSFSAKPKDIRSNLRRMIGAGLTEDQALAALTTHPAELLGLSERIGTVEQGKIANLVVTDKPYFQEKSKVRYVFVEGVMFRYREEEPKPEAGPTSILAGTWSVATDLPEGKSEEKVTIRQDGSNFSGSVTGGVLEQAVILENVTLDGSKLAYSYTVNAGGQSYKVDVQATVEGATFKGSATRGNLGTFPLAAKKDPDH